MTDEHYRLIQSLTRVTVLPGSWDKRFIGNMAAKGPDSLLSVHQAEWVERLAWKYRRQLPIGVAQLVGQQPPPIPDPAELEKLKAWNEGRAR